MSTSLRYTIQYHLFISEVARSGLNLGSVNQTYGRPTVVAHTKSGEALAVYALKKIDWLKQYQSNRLLC